MSNPTPRHRRLRRTLLALAGGASALVVLALVFAGSLLSSGAPQPTPLPAGSATPGGGGAGEIAFMSNRDGDWDIYLMNASGGNLRNLTNNDAADGFPAWSADGGQIVYLSDRDTGEIGPFVMDADGGNARSLGDLSSIITLALQGRFDWDLAWSPDGETQLFISLRDLNMEVYTQAAGERLNLSAHSNVDWFPAWSPDGARISFASERSGNREIYIINADGSGLTQLTNNPANDWYAVWTTDGEQIIFLSEREQVFAGGADPLMYTMNLDGSGVQRLSEAERFDADPTWSPDGEQVAFMSTRAGQWDIYVMTGGPFDVDASGVQRLTGDPAMDVYPIWRP